MPAPLDDVVAQLRAARITGLPQAFDTLVATGALVKVGGDVYRGTQIAEIRKRLEASVRRDGPITMARFRDAVGTTRKYAVPLMEWFDATGVTVRDGDVRALRARRYALTGANIASCSRRSFHRNDESSNATSSVPIGWSAGTSCTSLSPCARPIGTSFRSRASSAGTHVPYAA